jgi:hypothetical protein
MDMPGFLILLGGLWAASLPFIIYYSVSKKKYLWGLVASVPVVWFFGGYIAVLLESAT